MFPTMMQFLIDDWRSHLQPPWTQIALAIVAVVCGALVGTERERHEKPAGLRTLILVCLGSAAFTMTSFAFTTNSGDSGRVAAQIVTGIGFLGAGVIMHGRSSIISGTTTAATIWTTAAIGMTAGAGYAGAALGLSVLVRIVTSGIAVYEIHLARDRNEVAVEVGYEPREGTTRVRLERVLVDYRASTVVAQWVAGEGGLNLLRLNLHLRRMHLRELLGDIVDVPGVKSIRQTLGAEDKR